MGVGKSTVGKKLACSLNFHFLDTDTLIEEKEKMSISQIFQEKGEDYFRDKEHEILLDLATYDENLVVSTGGGTPCYRGNMSLLNSFGITVYLKLEPYKLFCRLTHSHKQNRPLIQNKTSVELMQYIEDMLSEREVFYHQSNIIFHGDNLKIKELEKEIFIFGKAKK